MNSNISAFPQTKTDVNVKFRPIFAWLVALSGATCWCVPARAESTISIVPSASARAASPSSTAADALREAESALQSVDYAAVYAQARRGLEIGRATVQETARLNVLVGLSAALLGHSEEARVHFITALAIQPSLRLERELSPKMREPYLEALGYWGAQPTRLALKVKVDEQSDVLSFHLDDPAQLSRHLTCFVRVGASGVFAARRLDARSRGRFELPKAAKSQGYSYYLELTDEHGNRLLEQGSDDDPLRVAPLSVARDPAGTGETRVSLAREERTSPLVLPITLISTGLVAAGAGIYFNVRRENLAERWNGNECERPGQSRGEQCADVQRDRANMERLAIGGYALGGALVAAGAGLLYLGSKHEAATPSSAFERCGISPLGAALYCQGRF